MHSFPTVEPLGRDSPVAGRGHLWILEAVEGQPLRFQLRSDGQIRFGDDERRLDPDAVEPAVRPALRSVQTSFRRDAFRESVGDVEAVSFFGVATLQRRVDYDWDRLPAFVGYDVYSDDQGGLLPPDAAHSIFDRLGLEPAPALERELRADAFDPGRYDWPNSAYWDGPVAGIRVADKHGWRARLRNGSFDPPPDPGFESPAAAVRSLLTPELARSTTAADPVTRARDRLARRYDRTLQAATVDPADAAFTSAIAEAIQRSEYEERSD